MKACEWHSKYDPECWDCVHGGSCAPLGGSMTVVEMSGNETDEQCKDIAWQMFCNAHPVEAYQHNPDGFWKYFHARAPDMTREQMVALLKECAEPESESPNDQVSLQPGTRYTKDGISVDIDDVKDGEVYVRRWPKGVQTQSFFSNCIRMPVAQFLEQVQGATMEVNVQPVVQRLREYWLYIWKEHHYLPGRPAEYSNPPVILKVPGLLEALEEAGKLTANSPKWEMYEGSGWSGKATVAAGHTPMKPLNAELSDVRGARSLQ